MTADMQQKAQRQKTGECIYCGAIGPITDDHVPPRSFYGSKPPDNLITVPCCGTCNRAFGKDDDYARMVFAVAEGATGNPARDELIPKIKRFVDRPESKNILKNVYQSLRSSYVPTDSGILVRREQVEIEGHRLDPFAVRVVKALFYREKGYRLPEGWGVNAVHHRRFYEVLQSAGEGAEFWAFIIAELNNETLKSWGSAFAYTWKQSPNHSDATWWMLHFYGQPLYLCSTFRELPEAAPETVALGDTVI